MIIPLSHAQPSADKIAPLERFFQRQLPVLDWPAAEIALAAPGHAGGVIRYLGRATAQTVTWLEDEPYRPLAFRSYPNRCLVPVVDKVGGVVMLAGVLKLLNTTEAEGFSIFEISDGKGGVFPFEVPQGHWMHWVDPSGDVRHFIPKDRLLHVR